MSLSPKKILAFALLYCSISFAQKKIDFKYFENNTELPVENIRVFMVTKSDTITPVIDKGKIQLSEKQKDNFSLFAKINGEIITIGSYRPAYFNQLDAIIVGRITDFSTLKQNWAIENTFFIDKEYLVVIPDSKKISDVIYATVKKDINTSNISNYKTYTPIFTSVYKVIKTKE